MSPTGTPVQRVAEAWIEAVWLSLAILIPLHFAPFAYFAFENHKVALLRCGAAAMAGAWLLHHAAAGDGARPRYGGRIARALLLLIGAHLLATVLSIHPWISFWGTVFRQQGLLTLVAFAIIFALVARFARRRDRWERLVTALVLASLPVCLYALVQRLGLDPIDWAKQSQVRNASTLGNPIFLGAYAAMVFFPTLGRWLEGAASGGDAGDGEVACRRRVGYGLLLLLQIAAMLGSGSRGPLLAFAVGVVGFAIAVGRGLGAGALAGRTRTGARNLVAAGGVLLAGLGAGAWASIGLGLAPARPFGVVIGGGLLVTGAGLRLLSRRPWRHAWPAATAVAMLCLLFLSVSGSGPTVDAERDAPDRAAPWGLDRTAGGTLGRARSARERILYWQGYRDAYLSAEPVRFVPSDPGDAGRVDRLHALRVLIGSGPEVGGAVFQQHYPELLAASRSIGDTADRAHNEPWDRLLTTGMLGLAAFLWLLVQLLQYGLSAAGYRMSGPQRWRVAYVLLGGSVGMAAAVAVWPGPEFFGPGFQLGLVGGLLSWLAFGPLRRQTDRSRWPVCCGLLAGMLCHLAEGTVGIAVAPTQLQFWLFAALLVSAATVPHRARGDAPASDAATRPGAFPSVARAGIRRGLLGGLMLGGIAFAFFGSEPTLHHDAARRLSVYGLSGAEGPQAAAGPVVLVGLLLVPWLGLLALFPAGPDRSSRPRVPAGAALTALLGFGLAWLAVATQQRRLRASAVPFAGSDLPGLCEAVADHARLEADHATFLYGWWGVMLVLFSLALVRWPTAWTGRSRRRVWAAAALVAVALPSFILFAGLRPAAADLLTRSGLRWRSHAPTSAEASADERAASAVAAALLWQAAAMHPQSAARWFHVADAASSLARDGPADASNGGGRLTPGRDREASEVCALGRTELFLLALDALGRARRLEPANPMVPLGNGHVYARWLAVGDAATPTAERRRALAIAWYEQARRLFGPFPEVEARIERLRRPGG